MAISTPIKLPDSIDRQLRAAARGASRTLARLEKELTPPGPFASRVALVTGAASGIGRATALALAAEGASVTVSDIDVEQGEATVRLIEEAGGQAAYVRADVTASAEVEAMVAATLQRWGRLDIAVNNAGIDGVRARTADYPEEVWSQVLAVNLTGVFLCMKHELPAMLTSGSGSKPTPPELGVGGQAVIINVSSVAGVTGFPGHAAYTASKHGVIGLTRTAALEYAGSGIRVNAVCPSYTRTPMVERMLERAEGMEQKLAKRVPLGRLATTEEVAQAVVYLASPSAAFITGHALVLDGGIMAE